MGSPGTPIGVCPSCERTLDDGECPFCARLAELGIGGGKRTTKMR